MTVTFSHIRIFCLRSFVLATTMSSPYLNDLTRIQHRAAALSTRLSEDLDEEEDSTPTSDKVLLGFMKKVCEVIHRATADGSASGEMPAILKRASSLLDDMVGMAYDGHELYDFVPSYAHFEGSAPLVKDPAKWNNGVGMSQWFFKINYDFVVSYLPVRYWYHGDVCVLTWH